MASVVTRDIFFASFNELLREIKPNRDLPPPAPETHLWESGYLDSFSMIKVVDYLEEVIGREIPIEPSVLSNFFTLERIYQAYIEEPA